MLLRIFKTFYTFLVISLIILGLNVSNQGINQVAGEYRGPVLNLFWKDHVLHWDWLGVGHDYSTTPIESRAKLWMEMTKRTFQ